MKYFLLIITSLFLLTSCCVKEDTSNKVLEDGTIVDKEGKPVQYANDYIKILHNGINENNFDKTMDSLYHNSIAIFTIDSCEYIYFNRYSKPPIFIHKQNCKFCMEREKKKEQKRLELIKIKEKEEYYGYQKQEVW